MSSFKTETSSAPTPSKPVEELRRALLAEIKRITQTKDTLISAQEKQIASLKARLAEASAYNHRSTHELSRLTRLLLDSEGRINAIHSSLSWKLLAPARSLQRMTRGLFSRSALRIIESSPLFDAAWYQKNNPKGCQSRGPAAHYLYKGAARGKNPGPCFDTRYYLSQVPSLETSGENPLVHFERVGKKAGLNPMSPRVDHV